MTAKKDKVDSPPLKNTEISIILPVLNEEENILPLLKDIRRELSGSRYNVCIIDDGSKDRTLEIINTAIQKGHPIHLIQREKKSRGSQRGSALFEGMQWGLANTDAEIFIEIDGDRSHRPEELPDGIKLIRSKTADVAIASKYVPGSKTVGRTFGRRCISYLANFFIGFCLDSKINDYSNGYRFYSRKAAEALAESTINYGSPIYLTEAMAIWLRRGMIVKEFPTTYVGRGEGLSKLRWTDIFKAIIAIVEISWRFHISGFRSKRNIASNDDMNTDDNAWNSRAVLLAAFFSSILFISMALFGPRSLDIDTLGLYNPIYTFLNFGKMTYPIHGFPDSMIVHPPIHYYSIALFLMLGIGTNYAISSPVILLFLVCIFAIVTSPFRPAIRCGALFALPITLELFTNLNHYIYSSIRPDLCLALAWFAGLIFLESARNENYNTRKLFLGAIFLTYASILHYFAFPAFFALVIYALVGVKDLGYRAGRIKTAAIAAGAGMVLIPYLIGWVIPYWNQIFEFANSASAFQGGIFQGFAIHIAQYQFFLANLSVNSLAAVLLWPVINFGLIIPLWIWIPLAAYKRTRILSIACLPMLLYVTIMSRKSYGYYYPELFLYFSVILGALFLFFDKNFITDRLFSKRYQILPQMLTCVVIIVFIACLWNNTGLENLTISSTQQQNVMDLPRACAQQIIGNNAYVGGRMASWYTGGGVKWHDISSDILWRNDPTPPDYEQFFQQFDFIEENYHMSDSTSNKYNETLGTLYLQNHLQLVGFYIIGDNKISASYIIMQSNLSVPRPVEGYIYSNDDILLKFSENVYGNYYLVTSVSNTPQTVVRHISLNQELKDKNGNFSTPNDSFKPYMYLVLPKGNPYLQQMMVEGDNPQQYLTFAIMDKNATDRYIKEQGKKDHIIKMIPGELKYESPELLLEYLSKSDKPITVVQYTYSRNYS